MILPKLSLVLFWYFLRQEGQKPSSVPFVCLFFQCVLTMEKCFPETHRKLVSAITSMTSLKNVAGRKNDFKTIRI
ncbi:hypothetical protein LINPERHAP1_LOCUS20784 [Linum perenne]